MKKQIYNLSASLIILLTFYSGKTQTVIYEENFGNPTANTTIQSYTRWQNKQVTYAGDGTCDIRNSNISSGYTKASGGGNVMINNTTKWFKISGLNTSSYETLKLHLGVRKNTTTENGSSLCIEVSENGIVWEKLPEYNKLSTGTGTTGWYYITIDSIPQYNNLQIKFSNLSTSDIRLDDISITTTSTPTLPSITIHSPTHSANYQDSVKMNIVVNNFILGTDGLLKIKLTGSDSSTTFIRSQSELDNYNSTDFFLKPGSYQYNVSLHHLDSIVLTPEVSTSIQFNVVMPLVATPTFSPAGGTYYESKEVKISSTTGGCTIYYTIDGSTPDEKSLEYKSEITISKSISLKAIAFKTGMAASAISTANYTIRDTTAQITLPFDISDNSEKGQEDISNMNGFYSNHIGTAYSDGSVKFEQARAGTATLTMHLDSAPDTLWCDLKGRAGGSAPQGYEGINFQIAESSDNKNWKTLLTLDESKITTSEYTTFCISLSQDSRYIRYLLAEAEKGNTQLNNIKIGKYTAQTSPDSIGILKIDEPGIVIYPNPFTSYIDVENRNSHINKIELYQITGQLLHSYTAIENKMRINTEMLSKGTYIIRIFTTEGTVSQKIIK